MGQRTIKMTQSFGGGEELPSGSIQVFDEKKAARFVDAGAAIYVDDEPVKGKTKQKRSRRSTKKASEER